MKVALIDGDSIIYILAWQYKDMMEPDNVDQMKGAVDQMVMGILQTVNTGHYIGALGHESVPCFRYKVAKYKPYKANRGEKDPWVVYWEQIVRSRLIEEWKFITIPELEADDIVSIGAELFNDRVICSPDKDLRQIAGTHFDYRKNDFAEISERQADYLFQYQMLVGDKTDNVAGLPGVGDKKAAEKLSNADETLFLEQVTLAEYCKYFGHYYGSIIFAENKTVLGLVNTKHPHYEPLHGDLVKAAVQHKEIQHSINDVFPGA